MWVVFALLQVAGVRAGCNFSALESCVVRAHGGRYWDGRCEDVAEVTADLTVSGGGVQVFIVPSPAGSLGAPLWLCGYPLDAGRCHVTRSVALGGPCRLVLQSSNDVGDVLVNGSFTATARPRDRPGITILNGALIVYVFAVIVYFAHELVPFRDMPV